MRLSKIIARATARAHCVAALLACVSLVACAAAFAQSGRRPPRPQEIAPVPTPTPEPTPPPRDDRPDVKIPLVVMIEEGHSFYLRASETDTVQSVVVARLRESRALEVSGGGRHMTRSEAIKSAKESATRHVVWLELRVDSRYDRAGQRPPPDYFFIEFTILEPGTAKRKSGGTVYLQRAYGPLGRVALPSCYPVMTHDIEFALGALEVAERVMDSLSLAIPRRCS